MFEKQLKNWYRWRTSTSKTNRALKSESTAFDSWTDVLKGTRKLSEVEIYRDLVYDESIKPLLDVEVKNGTVNTTGKTLVAARRFATDLFMHESEERKAEVAALYAAQSGRQKKGKKKDVSNEGSGLEDADIDDLIKCVSLCSIHRDKLPN